MHTNSFSRTIDVTTSAATTEAFSLTDLRWGRILLPSAANTTLTFYECDTFGGTYHLCDDVGTNGVLTVPSAAAAPQSVAIPTVLQGSRFIKIVGNVAAVTATIVSKG